MANELGEVLRKARKAKDYSMRQVGYMADVSHSHYSEVEHGKRRPSPDWLKKVAKALDLNYKHLLEVAGYIEESDVKAYSINLNGLTDDDILLLQKIADDLRKRGEG